MLLSLTLTFLVTFNFFLCAQAPEKKLKNTSFTEKKLECLKQAVFVAVNTKAWNNEMGVEAILLVCTTT